MAMRRRFEAIGLSICPTRTFSSRPAAIQFTVDRPGRYVVKFNAAYETFVASCMMDRCRAFLTGCRRKEQESFILMDYSKAWDGGRSLFRRRQNS